MIGLIIYPIVITIASLVTQGQDFLINLISLDSLFSAIHFMLTFINRNLTESQIVTISNSLYNFSLLDRYIYYILIYGLCNILHIFFWMEISDLSSRLLYYIGLVTITPHIINKILDFKLFRIIREKKELLVKIIVSKFFTTIIKIYSKIYLDRNIDIKYSELLVLLTDYKDTVQYFCDVLKNLLIMLGLSYIKIYSTPLYYNIIKYIYNYKTGDLIASYNVTSAKSYLLDIIDNRKWNELIKPNTCKAIMYIYQINSEKTNNIQKIVNDFNFSLIKMFTVWTLASIVDFIYLVPIISLGLLLYKDNSFVDNIMIHIRKIGILIFATLISYMYPNYIVISALCHYGDQILFNKLTHIMFKILLKRIKKIIKMIINNNKNFVMSYMVTICYIIILKYLIEQHNYALIGLNILANVLMNIEIQKQIIFAIVISTTYISEYNILHILFNSAVLYVTIGVLDKSNAQMPWRGLNSVKEQLGSLIVQLYPRLDILKHYFEVISNLWVRMHNKYVTKSTNARSWIINLIFADQYNETITDNVVLQLENDTVIDKLHMSNNIILEDGIFDKQDDDFINDISIDEPSAEIKLNDYPVELANTYSIINNYYV